MSHLPIGSWNAISRHEVIAILLLHIQHRLVPALADQGESSVSVRYSEKGRALHFDKHFSHVAHVIFCRGF